MVYYQKFLKEGVLFLSVHTLTKPCSYCEGHGYVQLLLGGSETCPYCKGTASEKEQK
ncbi:hypothetical protein QY95_00458 [Bacillus thermotolerans]|uniref:YuiA family protein n=1 Tax=Bacillus thermotolerans TaxID=1221996 RepID=A0A0F5I954_BACTR|nr:YuiA family protein [Bacillus thermotolerans]KKB41840.1 hypothetical protein QY95_00458 [Bacillus thermotolerans]